MYQKPPDEPPQSIPPAALKRLMLEQQTSSGASWFYWIGALSLVNSIMTYTHSDWSFPIGLGMTQLVDAVVMAKPSQMASILGASIDAIAAGAFAAFGYFSKSIPWLFIPGMVVYLLDTAVLGFIGFRLGQANWIEIGFHAFALYCLFRGYQSAVELDRILKLEALERSARIDHPEK